ncbi:MAG: ribonuclease P protein component [Actinomycetota bacterium]|nr:ribonuclease P protein component [Actinomycetota bacterium]MEC7364272.1 ribonuclease P protein component [Actinomycetota bacterium]MEC7590325.1 ribonuclease P protein component [Actinomycetota bacterium]MEC8647769.1 ribonuclease P protein component [Actinomycetota bacterium]MED5345685.1 ribonuclease P protein component [Actinomycetota bacterium]
MLPKAHRLTNSEDFRRTVRSGQRSVTPTVVVHSTFDGGDDPARFGVTVSKSVGGSVVRHRVARQIRHGILGKLVDVPSGSRWVIRALPAAGARRSGEAPSPGTDVQAGIELALRGASR